MTDREGVDVSQSRDDADDDSLELLTFTYEGDRQDHMIRIAIFDGDAWFVAEDVSKAVGCNMVSTLTSGRAYQVDRIKVDPDSLITEGPPLKLSSGDGVWLISEGRFYEVSSRHHAGELKRWVTHQVLPTIRHLNPRAKSIRRDDLPLTRQTFNVAQYVPSRGKPESSSIHLKKHSLYRFFDAKDRLLYVGITWNVANRTKTHRQRQPWWQYVHRMTVENYENKHDALEAERLAIREEHPRYNIAGVLGLVKAPRNA